MCFMNMFVILLLTVLLLPDSDGFDLSNLLRRVRPSRPRAPERKKPQLSVPLRGMMKWEITSPPTTPPTTKPTTKPTTEPTTLVNPTPGPTSGIGLNITECNKVFLPEFVAILSNNSFGQAVLDQLGFHQSYTTPTPEDEPELIYNDCQADFLPDFVAILSNSTMGQAVLENLQQQGLVTFRLSRA